jgi:hypothetical protein
MKSSSRIFLAAILLSAAAAGAAVAAGYSRGPAPFAAIDTDRDGRISAEEFDTHRAARQASRAARGFALRNAAQAPSFEAWDSDADGYLTPAELTMGQQSRMTARRMVGRPCPRRW